MSHHPNPFDFVPFAPAGPVLKSAKEWLAFENLKTGYLELQIQALTPVHIVGTQEAKNTGHGQRQSREEDKQNCMLLNSHFYRRHGQAFIPASSIRGLLRAFIEAACNGWASQMTPFYEKEKNKHAIGFGVTEIPPDSHTNLSLPLALQSEFKPEPTPDGKIDLASFLFGCVSPEKEKQNDEGGRGWRGRIVIEDARVPAENLSGKTGPYLMPDVEDSAFMGGPHPRASSWWYQKPYAIQLRTVTVLDKKAQKKRDVQVCDFIGVGFRGRKFYYHQDPQRCVDWYVNSGEWKGRQDHPVYTFPVECLEAGKTTESFRFYFENVPEVLFKLLLLALQPGNRLRHKLGYGKAYGYGSLNFIVKGGVIRNQELVSTTALPVEENLKQIHNALWDTAKLNNVGISQFLHRESLEKLAQIMWYQESLGKLFTYPPFTSEGFQVRPVNGLEIETILKTIDKNLAQELVEDSFLKLDTKTARLIATKLINRRPAVHFVVYQESAEGYKQIQERKLEQAV